MSEHTKGPWEAIEIKEGLWHVLPVDRIPQRIPTAILDSHRDGHEPTRTVITPANARLIAAAPELLEALKACHLQMLQSNNDSEYAQEANQMAIAAIAKAVTA